MGVSKVAYGGRTLVDLTADTVSASALRKGVTAHDARGDKVTGTLEDVACELVGKRLVVSGVKANTNGSRLHLEQVSG